MLRLGELVRAWFRGRRGCGVEAAPLRPCRLPLALLWALLLPTLVFASAGDLDPSFGTGGTVHFNFEDFEEATSMLVNADGSILIGGLHGSVSSNTDLDFMLRRYLPDGKLDLSFHHGTAVDFGGRDFLNAIARQQDGKIVAAGFSDQLPPQAHLNFALARYNADGTLDTSFGNGGKVLTPGGILSAVAIQSNGRIVVAGQIDSGPRLAAVARYLPSGQLDPSFGNGGIVTSNFGAISEFIGLAIQKDGKIVVTGHVFHPTGQPNPNEMVVARYRGNGQLDTTFGQGGRVFAHFPDNADGYALAIQADGQIVVAGDNENASLTTDTFALARFTARGRLDPKFGSHGRVTTAFLGLDWATAVQIQADGKIVAAGLAADSNGTNRFALARYLKNGHLDTSFGQGGKVTTDIGGGQQMAMALAILPDGRLRAAGYATETGFRGVALAGYLGQ